MNIPCAAGLVAAMALASGCASFHRPGDSWWGPDKARHFAVSAALAAGTAYAVARDEGSDADAVAAGFALASGAGTAKELYDLRAKRTYFSGKDLVWDLLGGLAGGFLGAAADR